MNAEFPTVHRHPLIFSYSRGSFFTVRGNCVRFSATSTQDPRRIRRENVALCVRTGRVFFLSRLHLPIRLSPVIFYISERLRLLCWDTRRVREYTTVKLGSKTKTMTARSLGFLFCLVFRSEKLSTEGNDGLKSVFLCIYWDKFVFSILLVNRDLSSLYYSYLMIILIEKQRDIKLFLHVLVIALVKKSLRFETIITKCSRHIRKRWRWGSRVKPTLMFTLKRDVLLIIIILLQNVSHNSAGTEPGFTVTRSQSLPTLLHWNSFLIRNELRDYYCCTTSLPPLRLWLYFSLL